MPEQFSFGFLPFSGGIEMEHGLKWVKNDFLEKISVIKEVSISIFCCKLNYH